jgi:abortive infection bacteriophage resistance protein
VQQIALLKQRGLQIESDVDAVHFLSHISYYRLGEYWQTNKKRIPSHFKGELLSRDSLLKPENCQLN